MADSASIPIDKDKLKELLPPTNFHTPKLDVTYSILSKYSEKLKDNVYVIKVIINSTMKFANVSVLMRATRKGFNDLVKLVGNRDKSKLIKFYNYYEVTKEVNFIPDRSIYMDSISFLDVIKKEWGLELLGIIVVIPHIKRQKDVQRTHEAFVEKQNLPPLLPAVYSTSEEAMQFINEI